MNNILYQIEILELSDIKKLEALAWVTHWGEQIYQARRKHKSWKNRFHRGFWELNIWGDDMSICRNLALEYADLMMAASLESQLAEIRKYSPVAYEAMTQ